MKPIDERDREDPLEAARGLAAACRWAEAANAYQKAIARSKDQGDRASVALFERERASCMVRSAFQSSKTQTDFLRGIKSAESAYQRSMKMASSLTTSLRPMFLAKLNGDICLAQAYVAKSAGSKRRLLQRNSRFCSDALRRLEEGGLEEGPIPAYLAYLEALSLELCMEWSPSARLEIIAAALQTGSKALERKFSEDEEGFRRRGLLHCLLGDMVRKQMYLLEDSAAREQAKKESYHHIMEAVDLANKSSDQSLISRVHVSAISIIGYGRRSEDQFRDHLVAALDSARATGDAKLIADALSARAYDITWDMSMLEVREKRLEKLDECKKLIHEAIEKYNTIQCTEGLAGAQGIAYVQACYRASFGLPEGARRLGLLDEAAKTGAVGLENFVRSGFIGSYGPMDNTPAQSLSYIVIEQALRGGDARKKRKLFREALKLIREVLQYRDSYEPFNNWDRGLDTDTESSIRVELSRLVADKNKQIEMLRGAARKELEAVKLCKLHFAGTKEIPHIMTLTIAFMANRVYVAYRELYDLTKEKESRDTMLSTLRETAILFEKAGWPSRAAQMHWRAAQTLERERSNILASREFRDASRLFEAAAALIPQFSEFFMDYSRYMSAWALIDVARADTAVQGYESAANNYSMSSKLMKTTRRWSGASVYFEGWAKLQMGEAMSAGGKFAEAVRFFEEAQGEFSRTGETQDNQESDPPMISVEERLDSSRLSSIRKQYAEGRAALENARLLDLQESSRSSEQYELASLAFGTVANEVGPGVERDEFTSMSLLCQGWKLLKEGEIRHSGTSFAEAAQRFEDAARIGVTKTMVLTAGANSHYSEAMRLGLEFSHTGDVDFYTRAKKHMETARSEYSDAQLIRNAAWVEAAMSILDARLYIFKGEAAENPVERAKLYASAERSLGYALAIGDKAGYHSRMTSLEKELARVRGKATAAQDLAQMIVAPPVSTAGNLIQTRPTEEANGLAVFEGINLQGQIRHEREVEIGGMLDIQLDVFNSGNKSASLLRVEDIASNDLKLASVQEPYRANEADLETGGKTIQPLRIQSFKVSLKAEETGEKTLSPKLVYKDETGKIRIQPLSVTRVKILPQSTFEFHEPAAKAIFDMLVKEFMRDYMNRKLSPEQSGWRSRGEIGKASGVSRSSLYEGSGKYGSPLYELLSRGLIELRTFSGHRGRGGEASKLRILYSNETVRRYVDRKIMKSA